MARALSNMFKALEILRVETENPDLQVVSAQMLLAIADRSSVSMAELEDFVSLSQAAVSRNVAKLGPGLTVQERGPGLVEAYEDPEYRRRKLVKLTPRGQKVVQSLQAALSA